MILQFLSSISFANADLEQGKTALQNKNYEQAQEALNLCLSKEPNNEDCLWEIGWAYWMMSQWDLVVKNWNSLESLNPNHTGLKEYLPQAQDNLNLQELLKKSRNSAPKTYASDLNATVKIRAVGDMMIGTDFPSGYLPPDGGKEMFSSVSSELKNADLTFGNLEGPLCDNGKTTKCKPGAPAGSCYAFRTPSSYTQYYKDAGFDVLSTANNHSGDFGQVCRMETEKHLDEAGIAHSGRPGDVASVEVNGLKIGIIGFHTNPSCHHVNDHDTAAQLVKALDVDHDLVLVSFHGGAEGTKALHVPNGRETFYGEDRGDLRSFARVVIDAGADAVIGHGPHVLRGMEIYKDRLIAYSLGNFATYGRFSLSGQKGIGVILELNLNAQGEFLSGSLIPTKQIKRGIPVIDDEKQALDVIRMLSTEDFGEKGIKVAQDGTLSP
ncbi:MAG: capsular biosynthesis protein [Proteobacteria bacterium]|nr:capsular biosynthesis protein [Pseudomonadota bacterium]